MPECSVIMAVYNAARTVEESVRSVLEQRDIDLELIAVDDGSNDASIEILERLSRSDNRVHISRNSENSGPSVSRNRALALARAPLTACIDSDDIWHDTGKLQRQVRFLRERSEYGLVGTWAALRGSLTGEISFPSEDGAIRKRILMQNTFIHSSVVYRTELAREVHGYRLDSYAEDYDLWLKIGTRAKFFNIPESLMTYTVTSTGLNATKRYRQMGDCLRTVIEHRREYPNFPLAYAKWSSMRVRVALTEKRPKTTA